jgi:methylthioribulose-1-phosphate dehydratase
VLVDEHGAAVEHGMPKPSAETMLHIAAVQSGAGAVLHTHSVWATVLSDYFAPLHGIEMQGYEMLKGLDGVTTHDHREWLPILANDQDMARLAGRLREVLAGNPAVHGVLLGGHGLYTWGRTIGDAERHVETLEFLLEVVGRKG